MGWALKYTESLEEGGRFAFINVWRSIREEPIDKEPLACCDASTFSMSDLCTFEIRYADRIGENYFSRFSDRHRWSVFPRMTREEVMLILQWDSAGAIARGASEGGPATFSLHSAVSDPRSPPDAVRESIEVRCVVVFDE